MQTLLLARRDRGSIFKIFSTQMRLFYVQRKKYSTSQENSVNISKQQQNTALIKI